MNVWKVLEQKAITFPATCFLKNGIRVYFHEMRVGDMVVTGPGGLHGGYNRGVSRASAVNYACLAWFRVWDSPRGGGAKQPVSSSVPA